MKKKKLIKWLKQQIKECENGAEECFQEIDNPEKGHEYLAEAGVYKKTLDFVCERNEFMAESGIEGNSLELITAVMKEVGFEGDFKKPFIFCGIPVIKDETLKNGESVMQSTVKHSESAITTIYFKPV